MKRYLLYRIARPIITLFMKTIYRLEIVNQKNIPTKGRCILAGNHTNNLDALVLISSTKRTIRFMAKKEIHKGIFKHIFKSAGTISVNREIKDKSSRIEAKKALENNEVLGIFPEGTINKSNKTILPFKYGTVSFAQKTSSPITPFIITGSYKPFKKSIKIEFLPSYLTQSNELTEENEKLMNIIKHKLEENNEQDILCNIKSDT